MMAVGGGEVGGLDRRGEFLQRADATWAFGGACDAGWGASGGDRGEM